MLKTTPFHPRTAPLVQGQAWRRWGGYSVASAYELQHEQGRVATTLLADRLGVAPASVTGMIKKLAGMHLVTHEPYQGGWPSLEASVKPSMQS